MPLPSRPLPRVGLRARVRHFGGAVESATIVAVHEDGRELDVRGERGETRRFVLSPATARFTAAGEPGGPRLELLA